MAAIEGKDFFTSFPIFSHLVTSRVEPREPKEGKYLAITMAPMYLAALPVGLISGGVIQDDTT